MSDDTTELPITPTNVGEPVSFDADRAYADLDEEEWPTSGPAKGVRIRIPTLVLLGLIVAMGALWIGATLQRGEGGGSAASGIASALSRFRGLGGASGFRFGLGAAGGTAGAGGLLGGASNAVTGTVTVVQGNTLYVTSATGALIKVSIASNTAVTRNASVHPTQLVPGDTVVVTGTKNSSGTVVATAIADTAQGVSTTRGAAASGG